MPVIDPLRLVLAVALSVALWLFVQAQNNPERQDVTTFSIPVEVVNAPSGLQVVSAPPDVRVEVRASERVWRRLAPQSFRATADASNATKGSNDLPVRIERQDPEVYSATAVPPTVPVRLEQVEEKLVPVRVAIAGAVPFGYSFSPPSVQPDSVRVSGPQSQVDQVVAAVVDLRLEGVTVSINSSYTPRPVNATFDDVKNVQVIPPAVNLTVQVNQQVNYKQVGVRPVTTGVPAGGYFVQSAVAEPATVTVVGNPSALAGIQFVETRPIDVSSASSTIVESVELAVPAGVSLLQQQPVNATVRIAALDVIQTIRVPITVTGLGPGLLLQSDLPSVDVTISGPAPTLQTLSPKDFQVLIDLSGLGPGKHSVTPNVVVPKALTLERSSPDQVTVTLAQPTPTPTATPTSTPTPTATPTVVSALSPGG